MFIWEAVSVVATRIWVVVSGVCVIFVVCLFCQIFSSFMCSLICTLSIFPFIHTCILQTGCIYSYTRTMHVGNERSRSQGFTLPQGHYSFLMEWLVDLSGEQDVGSPLNILLLHGTVIVVLHAKPSQKTYWLIFCSTSLCILTWS